MGQVGRGELGRDSLWDPQEPGIWDKLGEESWGDDLWDPQETGEGEDSS